MKIVIQSGQTIKRQDVDAFVAALPASLKEHIDHVNVLVSLNDEIEVSYHAKERTLALHCPKQGQNSPRDAITALAVGLLAVDDFGHIPERISKSRLKAYQDAWSKMQS